MVEVAVVDSLEAEQVTKASRVYRITCAKLYLVKILVTILKLPD